jgi:23S rRNA (cytosine1962-C5)-methyltransferase
LHSVSINRKAVGRLESGHPWIFRSDILSAGEAEPGETVRVTGANGRVLGTAHYSSTSQIALRMLSRQILETEAAFFRERIAAAQAYRERVVSGTNAYRLVHAEADGLPALIVDRYADYFTVQTLDQGMDRSTPLIVEALTGIFASAGIVARNDAAIRAHENLPRETKLLHGTVPASVELSMNGLRFFVDLEHGQKTGIFLDQRENYAAAARYAKGRALDCFTSTGGFAIHLAQHADNVEAVDSSGPALETAARNAEANGIGNTHFREADAFEYLAGTKQRFETIVLDPPAFAKSRSQVDAAVRAYKEINLRALKMLEPGGVLVTCSCSHHVGEAELLAAIAQASLDAKRTVRVLERRMQAQDHPVLLTVPETLYLKCLILAVE